MLHHDQKWCNLRVGTSSHLLAPVLELAVPVGADARHHGAAVGQQLLGILPGGAGLMQGVRQDRQVSPALLPLLLGAPDLPLQLPVVPPVTMHAIPEGQVLACSSDGWCPCTGCK